MDDLRLRQHYEQTGNLLDVLHDPDVMQDVIQLEAECASSIGAGFPAYSNARSSIEKADWNRAMSHVRLHSILFTELEALLQAANLGAGTEAALTEARKRVRQQPTQLTKEQQVFFTALIEEESLSLSESPLRSQLRSRLNALLSPADWNEIGQAATEEIWTQWGQFLESNRLIVS